MQVNVVRLLQSMNFKTRRTVTYVVLELPSGKEIQIAVDDATAEAIVREDVSENGQAPTAAMAEAEAAPPSIDNVPEETETDYDGPPPVVVSETETEVVREFGGDVPEQIAAEVPTTPAPPKRTKRASKRKVNLPVPPEPEAAALPPPAPPAEPKVAPKYPEPLSTQAYKKMVKEGVLPENAYHRTVPAVAGGYPAVIAKAGTADPLDVVGHENPDEDGVGSC